MAAHGRVAHAGGAPPQHKGKDPMEVLMIGTGEYTTGYARAAG